MITIDGDIVDSAARYQTIYKTDNLYLIVVDGKTAIQAIHLSISGRDINSNWKERGYFGEVEAAVNGWLGKGVSPFWIGVYLQSRFGLNELVELLQMYIFIHVGWRGWA